MSDTQILQTLDATVSVSFRAERRTFVGKDNVRWVLLVVFGGQVVHTNSYHSKALLLDAMARVRKEVAP